MRVLYARSRLAIWYRHGIKEEVSFNQTIPDPAKSAFNSEPGPWRHLRTNIGLPLIIHFVTPAVRSTQSHFSMLSGRNIPAVGEEQHLMNDEYGSPALVMSYIVHESKVWGGLGFI